MTEIESLLDLCKQSRENFAAAAEKIKVAQRVFDRRNGDRWSAGKLKEAKQTAKDIALRNYSEFSEEEKFLFHSLFPEVSQKAFPVTLREPYNVTKGFELSEISYW
jgi:hypothetical protein